jgi:hypothetical protein
VSAKAAQRVLMNQFRGEQFDLKEEKNKIVLFCEIIPSTTLTTTFSFALEKKKKKKKT